MPTKFGRHPLAFVSYLADRRTNTRLRVWSEHLLLIWFVAYTSLYTPNIGLIDYLLYLYTHWLPKTPPFAHSACALQTDGFAVPLDKRFLKRNVRFKLFCWQFTGPNFDYGSGMLYDLIDENTASAALINYTTTGKLYLHMYRPASSQSFSRF